jgi:hypothetical protein
LEDEMYVPEMDRTSRDRKRPVTTRREASENDPVERRDFSLFSVEHNRRRPVRLPTNCDHQSFGSKWSSRRLRQRHNAQEIKAPGCVVRILNDGAVQQLKARSSSHLTSDVR